MKTYNYTTAQFNKFRNMPEYFEDGVTTYVVETKKVFTKTPKDWILDTKPKPYQNRYGQSQSKPQSPIQAFSGFLFLLG